VEDCFAAYCWVVEHGEAVLGMQPTTILLAGDSAVRPASRAQSAALNV
jgi:acetyl esterase/lipase